VSAFLRPRTFVASEYPATPDLNILSSSIAALVGKDGYPYPAFAHARARSTKPVSLATGQWTPLSFDVADVNKNGVWIAEGSSLVVPARFAGRWRIGAAVDIETVACNKELRLIINASRVVAERSRPGVGSPIPGRITLATSVSLDVGDFIEAEAWHDLGVPISAIPGTWAPVLWAHWEGTDL
jgi:hypothetical protein